MDGLGRDRPTLFLSNDLRRRPRSSIIRYAGRNRVEDGLGSSVNFFHLDCLASEVRLNVDVDVAMTVPGQRVLPLAGDALEGVRAGRPRSRSFGRFVETSGEVEIQAERIVVAFRPPLP